jgi:hypothetical protein
MNLDRQNSFHLPTNHIKDISSGLKKEFDQRKANLEKIAEKMFQVMF